MYNLRLEILKLSLVAGFFALTPSNIFAEKTAVQAVAVEEHVIKDPKLIIDYQLTAMDHLIQMTDRTLSNLHSLRQLIDVYKIKQEEYLQKPEDKELLYHMAKSADQILNSAKNENLIDILDEEFLSEITMLAQIFRKISLPKLP